jgi:hypothetical protein
MIPRQYVIQRGRTAFWAGHDWTDEVREARWMTMDEATGVLMRLATRSPDTLHLIKDFGTTAECVLCTA